MWNNFLCATFLCVNAYYPFLGKLKEPDWARSQKLENTQEDFCLINLVHQNGGNPYPGGREKAFMIWISMWVIMREEFTEKEVENGQKKFICVARQRVYEFRPGFHHVPRFWSDLYLNPYLSQTRPMMQLKGGGKLDLNLRPKPLTIIGLGCLVGGTCDRWGRRCVGQRRIHGWRFQLRKHHLFYGTLWAAKIHYSG